MIPPRRYVYHSRSLALIVIVPSFIRLPSPFKNRYLLEYVSLAVLNSVPRHIANDFRGVSGIGEEKEKQS